MELLPDVDRVAIRGGNVCGIAGETLTLVGAGFPGGASAITGCIERSLRRSAAEIRLVIVTHNHVDHIGAIPELRRLASLKCGFGGLNVAVILSLPTQTAMPEGAVGADRIVSRPRRPVGLAAWASLDAEQRISLESTQPRSGVPRWRAPGPNAVRSAPASSRPQPG